MAGTIGKKHVPGPGLSSSVLSSLGALRPSGGWTPLWHKATNRSICEDSHTPVKGQREGEGGRGRDGGREGEREREREREREQRPGRDGERREGWGWRKTNREKERVKQIGT